MVSIIAGDVNSLLPGALWAYLCQFSLASSLHEAGRVHLLLQVNTLELVYRQLAWWRRLKLSQSDMKMAYNIKHKIC